MADKNTDSKNNNVVKKIGSRIFYVDPNDVNGKKGKNLDIPITPDYTDMCISFDLIVTTHNRLKVTKVGGSDENNIVVLSWVSREDLDNSNISKSNWVSFLKGADAKKFTTLSTYYTDLQLSDIRKKNIVEGLGVTNVTISFESYYTPTIKMKFIDVRGSSLFGREEAIHLDEELTSDNIFGCFFTFPYPKFKLQIKGFYGQAVTYQLMCSDFRGNFNSDTGNFEVDCTFLGYDFGILNDIPMQYIIAAPYCKYGNSGAAYWNSMVNNPKWQLSDTDGQYMPPMKFYTFASKIRGALENWGDDVVETSDVNTAKKKKEELLKIKDAYEQFVKDLEDQNYSLSDNNLYISDSKGPFSIMIPDSVFGANNTKVLFYGIYPTTANDVSINISNLSNSYMSLYNTINDSPSISLPVSMAKWSDLTQKIIFNSSTKILLQGSNSSKLNITRLFSIHNSNNTTTETENNNISSYLNLTPLENQGACFECSTPTTASTNSNNNSSYNIEIDQRDTNGDPLANSFIHNIGGDKNINVLAIEYPDIENEIEKQIKEADKIINTPVVGSDANEKLQTEKMKELGFIPTIGNVFKTTMCHMETFLDIMKTCAENIYGQMTQGKRNTKVLIGTQFFVSNDISSPKEIKDLIPWPGLAKKTRDTNGNEQEELAWVGDNNNVEWEEKKVIDALYDALKYVSFKRSVKPKNSSEINDKEDWETVPLDAISYPLLPKDINGWSEVSKLNADSLCGFLGLRAASLFGFYNNVLNNHSNIVGEIDAYNYFHVCGSVDAFKAIIDKMPNSGEEIIQVLLCNKDGIDSMRDENHHVFELVGDNKVTEKRGRHSIYKKTNNNYAYSYLLDGSIAIVPSLSHGYGNWSDNGSSSKGGVIGDDTDIDNEVVREGDDYKIALHDNITSSSCEYCDLYDNQPNIFQNGFSDNFTYKNESLFQIIYNSNIRTNFQSDAAKEISDIFCKEIPQSRTIDISGTSFDIYDWKTVYNNIFDYNNENLKSQYNSKIFEIKNGNEIIIDYSLEEKPRKAKYYNGSLYKNDKGKVKYCYPTAYLNFKDGSTWVRKEQIYNSIILTKFCNDKDSRSKYNEISYAFNENINIYDQMMLWCLSLPITDNMEFDYPFKYSSYVKELVTAATVRWYFASVKRDKLLKSEYKAISRDRIPRNQNHGIILNSDSKYDYDKIDDNIIHFSNVKRNAYFNFFEDFVIQNQESFKKRFEKGEVITDGVYTINPAETNISSEWNDVICDIYTNKVMVIDLHPQKYDRNNSKSVILSNSNLNGYLNSFITTSKKILANLGKEEEQKDIDVKDIDSYGSKRDIKVSLYMYLKNLWDRWLVGEDMNKFKVERYFSNFIFIDSFYNNCFDKIKINAETLMKCLDNADDKSMILKFLDTLASDHRCMFFGLPDYVGLGEKDDDSVVQKLKNMFTPIPYSKKSRMTTENKFVVMSIPNESKVSNENNGYKYDSFDIWSHSKDFQEINADLPISLQSRSDAKDTDNNDDTEQIRRFGYNIPSFGVAYGRQNNHIFKRINVGMSNPVVTEQSINTLSEIANRGSGNANSIVFYGSDLYPIYSGYSYICEIEMMGNAQIMPLMYFQLMNIPMFRGTYMIFSVTHTMTPGDMTTTIKAMKMSKFSLPYCTAWFTPAPKDNELSILGEDDIVSEDISDIGSIIEPKKITKSQLVIAESIYCQLKRYGYSTECIMAILGVISCESKFQPFLYNNGWNGNLNSHTDGGFGLIQWTGSSRRDGLISYVAKKNNISLSVQAETVTNSSGNRYTYKYGYNTMKNMKDKLTVQAEMEYFDYEMKHSYTKVYNAIKNSDDTMYALCVFYAGNTGGSWLSSYGDINSKENAYKAAINVSYRYDQSTKGLEDRIAAAKGISEQIHTLC